MKWKNRGHEFDKYEKTFMLAQYTKKKYYIFGAGTYGKELLSILRLYGVTITFIDNNIDLQNKKIEDVNVISLEKYLCMKDGIIIIAVSKKNTHIVRRQLEEYSLHHQEDFWLYKEFVEYIFPIISTYSYDKSYVSLAQISLTERCSLKCKKCAHGCYAIDNKRAKDLSLDQVYKSADSFFRKVDFIKEFVLIGGEPLLYKELLEVITYIGEHYRNQIGIYSITTNGTIAPNEQILKASRRYNILFRISNYAQQIPKLKDSHKRIINMLEMYDVSYTLGEEMEWFDYGFDYVDRNATEDELIEVFDACRTPCREIRENRFYSCVMARSVSDNLNFQVGEDDYLDLDKLEGKNYKKELLEFTLGYSDKGYLDMCNYCNGADAKNYVIPAAEQVEK